MATLHIAPGDSAGGSLRYAIRRAGRDDEVLSFLDDLSCGPIVSGDPAERAEWWGRYYDDRNIESRLAAFWDRVSTGDDRLVIWFGRHRASELAFSLAFADRLGDRPYAYIDVTGRQFPRKRQDGGAAVLGPPMQSVGIMNPDLLGSLLDSEELASAEFKEEFSQVWHRLRAENASFRIVTEAGLASAAIDVFDPLLLGHVTTEWQNVNRVTSETMGYHSEPYIQVNDVMLRARVAALVAAGKLLADGDPWDMRACRVRLPNGPVR